MNAPMYILTGVDGFTTCCHAIPAVLSRELLNSKLLPPITLHHWARVNGQGTLCGWKLCETKVIEGSL